MPLNERFDPTPVRPDLSFRDEVSSARVFRRDWSFVENGTLCSNIACTLQVVQISVLLVNQYNLFWSPASMIYKWAIVQIASVVEAVLQYDLKMVEDDPRLKEILGKEWTFIDWKEVPLPGVDVPDGQRAVTGLQMMVEREQLDSNAKMQFLIRASKKLEIIDEDLADELQELRKLRNRIHIKSLEDDEGSHYSHTLANSQLDLLERYRNVALAWTIEQRQKTVADQLADQVRSVTNDDALCVGDSVNHPALGVGSVTAVESGGVVSVQFGDGGTFRLMVEYAGLTKLS